MRRHYKLLAGACLCGMLFGTENAALGALPVRAPLQGSVFALPQDFAMQKSLGTDEQEIAVDELVYFWSKDYGTVLNCYVDSIENVTNKTEITVYEITEDATQQFRLTPKGDHYILAVSDGTYAVTCDSLQEGAKLHCGNAASAVEWKLEADETGFLLKCTKQEELVLTGHKDGRITLETKGKAGQNWEIVSQEEAAAYFPDTDISLITDVRDLRGSTASVAGVKIEVQQEGSGPSVCEGNGFLYETLREYCEKDGNIYGAVGNLDKMSQKIAVIGAAQYSLVCMPQGDGKSIGRVYSSDLTDAATFSSAIENGGPESEQGKAIHMQQMVEASFETNEEPEIKCVIYESDMYLSWKDSTSGWQTKKFSFADGTERMDETACYYDSFGNTCYTFMKNDNTYHIRAYDGSWDYTVEENVVDSVVMDDIALLLCEKDGSRKLLYYRNGATDTLKELPGVSLSPGSVIAFNDTWLYCTENNGNSTTISRVQMTTGTKEKLCTIAGPKVTKIISEEDYLFAVCEMSCLSYLERCSKLLLKAISLPVEASA